VLVRLFGLIALAGLVFGVGEACVDGVVQVEALAIPGRDDGAGGDVGVVTAVDVPVDLGQGGAGEDQGPVWPVEGEGTGGGSDEIPRSWTSL
jgi:hypothetical protein